MKTYKELLCEIIERFNEGLKMQSKDSIILKETKGKEINVYSPSEDKRYTEKRNEIALYYRDKIITQESEETTVDIEDMYKTIIIQLCSRRSLSDYLEINKAFKLEEIN